MELLARQQRGLHGVRQRVHVDDPHALEVGDPVEVEVVRQDRPAVALGQLDELRVHLPDARDVLVRHLDRRRARPSASGRGSRGRVARGCGAGCRSCRRAAGPRRARSGGTTRVPMRKPDSAMSAIRPSMIALVSTRIRGPVDPSELGHRSDGGCRALRRRPADRGAWRPSARPSPGPGRRDTRAAPTVPIGAGSADTGSPSSRPSTRPRNSPMIAVTNSASTAAGTARSDGERRNDRQVRQQREPEDRPGDDPADREDALGGGAIEHGEAAG